MHLSKDGMIFFLIKCYVVLETGDEKVAAGAG
jgi:hypothetical protein